MHVAQLFYVLKFLGLIERYSKVIKKILLFIGKNSLICLCLHIIGLEHIHWTELYIILEKMHIHSSIIRLIIINVMWVLVMLIVIKLLVKSYHIIKEKICEKKNVI